jgi:hypothetical protein
MTPRPSANGHAERFDLDAAIKAAAGEAEAVPFRFSYAGADYEVPPATSWPIAAMAALAAGDLAGALTRLLGDDAYAQLEASGLTLGGLNALFEAIGAASGVGSLPNSSPPPRPVSTPR